MGDAAVAKRLTRHSSVRSASELELKMLSTFKQVDKDGDGHIDKAELVAALQKRAPEISKAAAEAWADKIFLEYDADSNGKLELKEFMTFISDRIEALRKVFEVLDHSNTGKISNEDVEWGLKQADISFMQSDVQRLLARMGGGAQNGVTFQAFFDVSVLLPAMSAQEQLLTLTGVFPMAAPPPGTTPAMLVTAGFINGAVSRTLTAPTDRLRAVLATGVYSSTAQAFRGILREQGVLGFWSSNTANVVQVAPENGISFFLNDVLRNKMCSDAAHPSMAEKFLLGSTAGAIAMTMVYPMYVVQNRMAAARAGQYNGMMDCVREVSRGGTSSMYAGFGTALVRVMPLKGIMLGGYSVLKDAVKDPRTGEISTAKSLLCSAASGGAAHALTYPLHLARTVLQQAVPPGGRVYSGFVDVLSERLRTQGIGGCFRGLPIWLCNRVPAVAIEFAVNERALDAMKKWQARR